MQTQLMCLRTLTILALFVLLASSYPLGARASPGSGSPAPQSVLSWQLGAGFYPHGTQRTGRGQASNAEVQQLFGGVHTSRYATLHRIDGQGWLQVGKLATHNHKSARVVLTWLYAVSYYPDAAGATHAAADVNVRMTRLSGAIASRGVARFSRRGHATTLALLRMSNVEVEILCSLNTGDRHQFGSLVDRYCTMQREALTRLLIVAAAPAATATATVTSTVTPTATDVVTPSSTPQLTSTATPTLTATLTATPPPTPTRTPSIIVIIPRPSTGATQPVSTPKATSMPTQTQPTVAPAPTNTPVCPVCQY